MSELIDILHEKVDQFFTAVNSQSSNPNTYNFYRWGAYHYFLLRKNKEGDVKNAQN